MASADLEPGWDRDQSLELRKLSATLMTVKSLRRLAQCNFLIASVSAGTTSNRSPTTP